jgi:hypothetical protein
MGKWPVSPQRTKQRVTPGDIRAANTDGQSLVHAAVNPHRDRAIRNRWPYAYAPDFLSGPPSKGNALLDGGGHGAGEFRLVFA